MVSNDVFQWCLMVFQWFVEVDDDLIDQNDDFINDEFDDQFDDLMMVTYGNLLLWWNSTRDGFNLMIWWLLWMKLAPKVRCRNRKQSKVRIPQADRAQMWGANAAGGWNGELLKLRFLPAKFEQCLSKADFKQHPGALTLVTTRVFMSWVDMHRVSNMLD